MLTLNTLRRRLLLAGSSALLGILTACGGTADVNEIAPTPAPPAQTAPAFNTQPASVTVTAPAAASFSVAVSGNPTPTLQWQVSIDAGVNWVNVPAATAATLTINPTIVGQNNNRYRAVATNSVGSVNSSAATLTVNAPGVNVPWQADQLIAGGGTQTLVVRANGELWSWGTNNAGALGRADGNTVTAPGAVTTFGNNVRSVAAGAWYSVALRNDGGRARHFHALPAHARAAQRRHGVGLRTGELQRTRTDHRQPRGPADHGAQQCAAGGSRGAALHGAAGRRHGADLGQQHAEPAGREHGRRAAHGAADRGAHRRRGHRCQQLRLLCAAQ
jgi:hypothetical protein